MQNCWPPIEFSFRRENRSELLNDDEQTIDSLAADKNSDRNRSVTHF